MFQSLNLFKISEERKIETIIYIEKLMYKSSDEVQKLAKTSGEHCRYVMTFFQLPKTDLHTEFTKKFIEPEIKLRQKQLEGKIIGQMKDNKQKFIKEHLIDQCNYNDVKYQICDRYYVGSDDELDEVIQISIPYFSMTDKRDKFGYGIIIRKSECPEFFEDLTKKMRVYNGNADLASNKK